MRRPRVAVIIPVYDPPAKWEVSCCEHVIALNTLYPHFKFHFVFVNDGSPKTVLYDLHKHLRRMKIPHSQCHHQQNFGKGRALQTGVKHIQHWPDYFICVDWDFPFGPNVVEEIVEQLQKGSDVVVAERAKDYGSAIPLLRSLVTGIWKNVVVQHFHLGVRDTQAGIKGFSRAAVPAFLHCKIDTFLHDLEFLLNCRDQQLRLKSVPVFLRGGIKLTHFSLKVYLRELAMLLHLVLRRKVNSPLGNLVVNADDFGMTREINNGIKEAILAGKINSVSVLVSGAFFEDAVKFLKKHPHVRVGLHFALKETLPSAELFPLLLAIVFKKITREKVRRELTSQFQQLEKTGLTITHLDSHQHVHLYPPFFALFCTFAKKQHINRVRSSQFSLRQLLLALKLRPTLKQIIIWTLYGINGSLFRGKNTESVISQSIYDLNWRSHLSLQELTLLRASFPQGATEIICHLSSTYTKDPLSRNRRDCLHLLLRSDLALT